MHQQDIAARMTELGAHDEQMKLKLWQQQQEMTFPEMQRLQQQKSAVAEIMANPDLDDATKNDLVMQVKTHIDMGEVRLKQQQAKRLDEQSQLYHQQQQQLLASEGLKGKYDAMSFEEKMRHVPNQKVLAEVTAMFPPVPPLPDAVMGVLGGPAAAAAQQQAEKQRQDAIMAEVAKRGGMQSFYQHELGKWTEIKPEKSPHEQKPELGVDDFLKIRKDVEHEADAKEKSFDLKSEERAAWVEQKTNERWMAAQKVHGELQTSRKPQQTITQPTYPFQGGGTSPPPPPPPNSQQKVAPTTEEMAVNWKRWQNMRLRVDATPALNPAQKQNYVEHYQWAVKQLHDYRSAANMPPDVQKRYLEIVHAFDALPLPPPPPPPPVNPNDFISPTS